MADKPPTAPATPDEPKTRAGRGRAVVHGLPQSATGAVHRSRTAPIGLRGCAGRCSSSTALAFTVSLLANLVGCNGRVIEPLPPRDAREAVRRINDNLAKIENPLYCKALTSFRFRDANGRDRRFIGQRATVIFEAPRSLYFDIKHELSGSVAHIGSNDERYWLWLDTPEARKLWHGTWKALKGGHARRLAVPPNQLLDALLMRPLPERLPDGSKPLLLTDGRRKRLVFLGLDGTDWPFAKRELVLDPKPPYMPLEIIDRLGDGRVVMHAYVSNYKPVRDTGRSGPHTPRRYVLKWELDQSEMRLDFSDVRYRIGDAPFCEFPGAWEGESEALDEPPTFEAPGMAEEGTVQR